MLNNIPSSAEKLDKITNATTNVEMFNGLTMDKSKTMFKECLGTEFPFDVIEAVQDYVGTLANALNSGLDGLLCGNALGTMANATNALGENISSSTDKAGDSMDELQTVLGLSDDGNTATVVEPVDFVISSYPWLKTYTNNPDRKPPREGKKFPNINEQLVPAEAKGYGIDSGTITTTSSFEEINEAEFKYKAKITVSIDVSNLLRGPHDGSSTSTDGTNLLEPVSGVFKYTQELKTNSFGANFNAVEVPLSSEKGITLRVAATLNIYNETIVSLSIINYKKNWCSVSGTPTSDQIATSEAINASVTDNFKNQALNSLKSQFMMSSEIDGAMDRTLDKLVGGNPALAGVNTSSIKNSVKETIANNAISLANGNGMALESTVMTSIAAEVTSASINNGIAAMGVSNVNISTQCTKELLDKLASMLNLDGTYSLADPFGKIKNFINFDDAYNFAKGVIDDLMSRFNKLLNSDCMQAVNNSFDLCNSSIAEAAGSVADFAGASSKGSNAAKKYLDSVTGQILK